MVNLLEEVVESHVSVSGHIMEWMVSIPKGAVVDNLLEYKQQQISQFH